MFKNKTKLKFQKDANGHYVLNVNPDLFAILFRRIVAKGQYNITRPLKAFEDEVQQKEYQAMRQYLRNGETIPSRPIFKRHQNWKNEQLSNYQYNSPLGGYFEIPVINKRHKCHFYIEIRKLEKCLIIGVMEKLMDSKTVKDEKIKELNKFYGWMSNGKIFENGKEKLNSSDSWCFGTGDCLHVKINRKCKRLVLVKMKDKGKKMVLDDVPFGDQDLNLVISSKGGLVDVLAEEYSE